MRDSTNAVDGVTLGELIRHMCNGLILDIIHHPDLLHHITGVCFVLGTHLLRFALERGLGVLIVFGNSIIEFTHLLIHLISERAHLIHQ